jgi:hypothetical protein
MGGLSHRVGSKSMFLFNTAFTSQFNLDRRSTATVNGMGQTCRPAGRTTHAAAQYHWCRGTLYAPMRSRGRVELSENYHLPVREFWRRCLQPPLTLMLLSPNWISRSLVNASEGAPEKIEWTVPDSFRVVGRYTHTPLPLSTLFVQKVVRSL